MANRIAVVTGASAGIGRALALQLVAAEYTPLLIARRKDKLEAVAGDVVAAGGKPITLVLDICAPGAAEKALAAARKAGDPEILVNNAGKGTYDNFAETPLKDSLEVLDLNCRALVEATRVFLPAFLERKQGYVLNVASTAGFQAIPRQAVYAATKSFVITFTESLASELRKTGVSATALCPGPTETEFLDVAGYASKGLKVPRAVLMSADEVAAVGLKAMFKRKSIAIAGLANAAGAYAARVAPRALVTATSGFLFKPR